MDKRVSTIIIEPRLVLREALELLMGNHSYRVVCGVGSTAEITSSVISDVPELVILGAQAAISAAKGAAAIRSLWPTSKIIFLFDDASPADLQSVLASQIDGCIPLFVSPDTLINTLDLIVSKNVRVMVMGDTKPSAKALQDAEASPQPASKAEKPQSNGGERAAISVAIDMTPPFRSAIEVEETNPANGHVCVGAAAVPKLSEREIQILDGLVRGYANKVIARRCDISEATVKVHMKSILRKIRVGNRTQAAIWALEHGHCSEDPRTDGLKTNGNPEHTGTNGFEPAIGEIAR
jgi:two-component system, NarL family, nitrate/nitrite response regulator NarL